MKQYIVCFLALLALTGCTSALWESPTYTERVKGYYVVPDKNLLIIDGEKYSYTFTMSKTLKNILSVSHKFDFQPTYKYFKIDSNNDVTGLLELSLEVPNDSSQVENLIERGFTKSINGISYETRLSGKLYQIEVDIQVTTFETEQLITVEKPESSISKVGKIIITPVAATADAIAVVSLLSLMTVGYYSAILTE